MKNIIMNKNDINNPNHYVRGGIECIDAIQATQDTSRFIGFLEGNVKKYLWRWDKKDGVKDLYKAQVYLDRLIGEVEKVTLEIEIK